MKLRILLTSTAYALSCLTLLYLVGAWIKWDLFYITGYWLEVRFMSGVFFLVGGLKVINFLIK